MTKKLTWSERVAIALIDGFEEFLDRHPLLDYVVCKILDKIQDLIRAFAHEGKGFFWRFIRWVFGEKEEKK